MNRTMKKIDVALCESKPQRESTVAFWLLNLPGDHPLWSEYFVSAVRLKDIEGMPPATITVPGATHEIIVAAIDPKLTPEEREKIQFRPLHPLNHVYQFQADDACVEIVLEKICEAFVQGNQIVEPSGIRGARDLFMNFVDMLVAAHRA